MATDVVFRFDEDDRGAGLARYDRGGQPGRAGTDHDDVGFAMPVHCICHFARPILDAVAKLSALPTSCEVAQLWHGGTSMADIVPAHRLTHEASLKMIGAAVKKA